MQTSFSCSPTLVLQLCWTISLSYWNLLIRYSKAMCTLFIFSGSLRTFFNSTRSILMCGILLVNHYYLLIVKA